MLGTQGLLERQDGGAGYGERRQRAYGRRGYGRSAVKRLVTERAERCGDTVRVVERAQDLRCGAGQALVGAVQGRQQNRQRLTGMRQDVGVGLAVAARGFQRSEGRRHVALHVGVHR